MMVSVILPAYNEQQNIVLLIDALTAVLAGHAHELLIVDDRSPDGTADRVRSLNDPGVRLLEREISQPRSYARSIFEGIMAARGDVIVIMDSDFNHDPADVPRLLTALARADCVSASRFLPGGGMADPWRWVASGIFHLFIRALIRSRVTDHLFGFFAVRREVLEALPLERIFYGFGDYGMRLLYACCRQGARIVEIPAVCGRRRHGQGNRQLGRIFWCYTWAVLRLAGKGL
jgi:dolichol-phosphate mannosyltransferase